MMNTQAAGAQDLVEVRKCAVFCLGMGTVAANTCGVLVALQAHAVQPWSGTCCLEKLGITELHFNSY